MDKRGFEVGVNFLVVMILSIVIIGMGLAMFTDLFSKVERVQDATNEQTRRMIDSAFETGEPVVVIRNSRIIRAGKDDIFHIGINNEFNTSEDFQVAIVQKTSSIEDFEIIYDDQAFTLKPGGRKYMPFKIEVPGHAQKKSYIFDVNVCYNGPTQDEGCQGSRYYLLQKVYVNVP